MKVLDLFSGIGGFSLGLERAGMETVAFCEVDAKARQVLAKHWPGVPIYDDVRTLTAERLAEDGVPHPDLVCGGFPCQDISNAGLAHGLGAGLAGERSGLWFEMHRIISEVQPKYAIIENVSALRSRGLDQVLRSFAEIRYDAEWHCIPASAIGAPQRRDRIWIVAHPAGQRVQGLLEGVDLGAARQGWQGRPQTLLGFTEAPDVGCNSFPEPLLRGMDDRPANWVDRVKACGNAVVPQLPELIGRAILAS